MNAIHPSCLNFHSSEDSFFAFAIKEFAVISKHMNSKYLEIPVWQINFQLFKFSFQHQTAQNTIYLARMVGCAIKTIVNCYYKYSCNIKEIRSGLETLIFEMCYHKTNAHKALKTQRTLPFTNAEKPPKHQLKWFSFPKKRKNYTYKVNCSKTSMSNFMQTHEYFLRIIFVEQVSYFWVLWHPFAHGEVC